MPASVSVIIPSRNRPELLLRAITSLRATAEVELIVVIDNDPDSYERLSDQGIDCLLYNEQRAYAIKSWNRGLSVAGGTVVVTGADDVEFLPGWLEAALHAHQQLEDYGVVGLNDNIYDNGILATHVLVDKAFCRDKLGGVIYCPLYHHYFVDNELNERAKRAGRFNWCRQAQIKHHHPANGLRQPDEQDSDIFRFWTADETLYRVRYRADFPNNYEAVI